MKKHCTESCKKHEGDTAVSKSARLGSARARPPRLLRAGLKALGGSAQASASWLAGGCFQRQVVPQAAPSFGQPRPISRVGRADIGLVFHIGDEPTAAPHGNYVSPSTGQKKKKKKKKAKKAGGEGAAKEEL